MATKRATSGKKTTSAPKKVRAGSIVVHADPALFGPSHEEIARRAYELYQSRGWRHGGDLEDWLAAERELTQH
jgi:hypothetical protein